MVGGVGACIITCHLIPYLRISNRGPEPRERSETIARKQSSSRRVVPTGSLFMHRESREDGANMGSERSFLVPPILRSIKDSPLEMEQTSSGESPAWSSTKTIG